MVAQVSSQHTWDMLSGDMPSDAPEPVLIDVRTPLEWQQIGVPDLATLGRAPLMMMWQPGGEVPFAEALVTAVPARETPLYFLCRSGARSQAASQLAEHLGYGRVHNVADGFEGPPDETGRRGRVMGWQAAGLPTKFPT